MKFVKILLVVVLFVSAVACQNKKVEVSKGNLQSIYFDFDQSFIRSDAVPVMQGNASYIKSSGKSVAIEGNCDSRGTNEYNMALGHRRAESAKNYLVNLGTGSGNLRTVSYGEEKQVCYSNDEVCWQKNRRADFRD
jgi:peptidoglycan-associated lipoprotein